VFIAVMLVLQRLADADRRRLAAVLPGILSLLPSRRSCARGCTRSSTAAPRTRPSWSRPINGIDTLKAMAVEPQMARRWENQLAAYVSAGFRTATLGTLAHEGVSLIGKLVTVATMWLGARLVIDGDLTVGQLIAFNMLAGRVATPVMRLAQLWTDFQQTGISVQRLGDILNARQRSRRITIAARCRH
jgi:ABC-type bacteriocin/lantibiotic exporter with double-glycine peptidase domain